MSPRMILAVMLLAIASTTMLTAEESPSLFLVDGTFQGQLTRVFLVNADTGALQLRADLGTTYTPMLGMAAASGTTLYLSGTDTGPGNLCAGDISCLLVRVEMDPISTTPTLVQVIGTLMSGGVMVPGITGLTFRNDGRLYAISQSTNGLYTIDLNTAEATLIGIVDIPVHGGDITFDGSDRLWLWANIGGGSGIYQVDPVTAHASVFDLSPGLDLAGMAALGHGETMRGARTSNDRLYEMDTTVGLTGVTHQLTLDGVLFDHSRGDLDSPYCEGDAGCADQEVCTTDVCGPGGCNHPPVTDGAVCDDGDLCTQVDSCQSGACAGGSPVVCAAPDACHDPGTCDPTSGNCENAPLKPDGTPCDDGNACTQVDSCQSGTCVGAAPAVCAAVDACHDPGTCNPATGTCEAGAAKPDGTQCDDANACTQVDSCQVGACVGTSPVICTAADACHDPGTCNAATGTCGAGAAKPDGTQCDDANACTQVDSCQVGACVGTSPVICTAADACHDPGTCNAATGTCGAGAAKPDGTQCDDANACTQVDSCQVGACVGTSPVICTAADACHDPGTCNAATGTCGAGAAKPDGTQCDDANACTQVDSCQVGACVGTSPVICTASDACHDPGTCNAATGTCGAGAAKPDGTSCSDGNICTQQDACSSGVCLGGPPLDLDGDGHVDASCGGNDCIDSNPFVWLSPFEVTNLSVSSGSSTSVAWDDQNVLAGPGTTFNLASGKIADLKSPGFSQSSCLLSAGGNAYTDARPDPLLGEGYWYLARAQNSCGIGTFGSSQRDNGIVPCP